MNEKKAPAQTLKDLLAQTESPLTRELKKINFAQEEARKAISSLTLNLNSTTDDALKALNRSNDIFGKAFQRSFEPLQLAAHQTKSIFEVPDRLSVALRELQVSAGTVFSHAETSKSFLDKIDMSSVFKSNLDLSHLSKQLDEVNGFINTAARNWEKSFRTLTIPHDILSSQSETKRVFDALESVLNYQTPILKMLNRGLASAVSAPSIVQTLAAELPPLAPLREAPTATPSQPTEDDLPRQYAWSDWLMAQSKSTQLFFFFLFFLVVQPFFNAMWSEAVDRLFSASTAEEQVQIIQESNNYFGPERTADLRCVRASKLKVRKAASSQSTVIGQLAPGQAVEVLEVDGVWSFVRYRDASSGDLKEGWAASSFLKRYTC